MSYILSAIAAAMVAACGGGIFGGGTRAELFLDLVSPKLVETTVNGVAQTPAVGSSGTMCAYYVEQNCNGDFVQNDFDHLATQTGYSLGLINNIPASFVPTGSAGVVGTANQEYNFVCADFQVGANGDMQIFTGFSLVNGAYVPQFTSKASFKLTAENPNCTNDVAVKNGYVLAALREAPNKIYASRMLFDRACSAGGSDHNSCSLTLQSEELRFDTYNLNVNWPVNTNWLTKGLGWKLQ